MPFIRKLGVRTVGDNLTGGVDLILRLSLMPDHFQATLRGNQAHSPNGIVDTLQNPVAFALGQAGIWEAGFHVGTLRESNMEAIRHTL